MPHRLPRAAFFAILLLAPPLTVVTPALAQPAAGQPSAEDTGKTLATPAPGALRGSKLIGLPVIGMDHVRVGAIEDLLVGGDGRIEAVVIGVGGFLGIGEKWVAVPYDQIAWNLKDVSLTSGPTSVTTPETAPSAQAASKVGPDTMPGANTTRDVLGSVEGKHSGKVTDATGSVEADKPTSAPATVLAGNDPLHAEIRMTKAQLNAAPAFRYEAARKADK
jgi:sporulation protein YlmC with PRC-barrel domain